MKVEHGVFGEWGDRYRVYVGTLFRALRRFGIMGMTQGGIAPTVAKAISGHKTDSVFKRYNSGTRARLIDASWKADAFKEAQRRALSSGTVVQADRLQPEQLCR